MLGRVNVHKVSHMLNENLSSTIENFYHRASSEMLLNKFIEGAGDEGGRLLKAAWCMRVSNL